MRLEAATLTRDDVRRKIPASCLRIPADTGMLQQVIRFELVRARTTKPRPDFPLFLPHLSCRERDRSGFLKLFERYLK